MTDSGDNWKIVHFTELFAGVSIDTCYNPVMVWFAKPSLGGCPGRLSRVGRSDLI